jgi:signal transduction histidine kinase
VRALGGLVLAVLLLALLLDPEPRNGGADPTNGTSDVTTIRAAELILSGSGGSTQPPESEARGTQVELPHQAPETGGIRGTYRVMLVTGEPTPGRSPGGICLPPGTADASVWIDGRLLRSAETGSMGLRVARHWKFVSLPPDLPAGAHRLELGVEVPIGLPMALDEILVGDGAAVRRACSLLEEQGTAQRISGLSLMILMGLVSLAIGLIHQDRAALWFGGMAVIWTSHHLLLGANWSWIDENLWVQLLYITRPLAAFPMLMFCVSYVGIERPMFVRGLIVLLVIGLTTFLLLPPEHWRQWVIAFGFVLLVLIAWQLSQLVRFSLQQPGASAFALSTTLCFGFLANLVEIGSKAGLLPFTGGPPTFFVVVLLSLSICVLLLERLARFVRQEEENSERLREELARQRAKLAQDHALMQSQRERIAVLEERRRIVRDMHDGLGTQLVSASALLRSGAQSGGPLSEVVEGALQEFRIVLDVLSSPAGADPGEDAPVSLLLAKLRHRIEPTLRAQGITLDWDTDPLPGTFSMPDPSRIQLLRLLQEGFANVLKHARATRVRFSVRTMPDRIVLEIADDGRGIPPGTRFDGQTGLGLFNMHVRAEQLGALLEIGDASPGTRIRLSFALETPPDSAPSAVTSPAA